MNQQDKGKLKFLLLFSAAFTASSFLFSFLSLGRGVLGPPEILQHEIEILVHMGKHAILGGLAALPTRRIFTILTGAIGSVLFDVDHVGSIIGLPMDGRSSHGLLFMGVVFVIIFWLTRKRILGKYVPPLVAGSLAVASVAAHLALDAMEDGGVFPMWMPFSNKLVMVSPLGGVLLEIMAFVLIWAATTRWHRQVGSNKRRLGFFY